MRELVKGISSGTTAVLSRDPVPDHDTIATVLSPVRGIGGDIYVSAGETLRAFTSESEIPVPTAAVRLAAAYAREQDPSSASWEFRVDGRVMHVTYEAGEYVINHGQWSLQGGPEASAQGFDITVVLPGLDEPRPGLRVTLGGKVVGVVALATAQELASVDLRAVPTTSAEVNLVALMNIMGEREVDLTDHTGALVGKETIGAMQVRGFDASVGEVFSSDALAIGCAAAAHTWSDQNPVDEWVAVFGAGNTAVTLDQYAIARAPAEIFARVSLSTGD